MTLIHTAFLAEAKPLIEHLKLTCIQTNPYKVYKNSDTILCILGMGAKKTLHVRDLFDSYDIKRAVNVGIAGCKNKEIGIGTLFCTSHKLKDIPYESLTSVNAPLGDASYLQTTLVDMEAKSFTLTCKEFLKEEDIYVLKVVSDHLDTSIPKKEFVWKIIEKNLKNISKIVTLKS